jgi:hypothetical protein
MADAPEAARYQRFKWLLVHEARTEDCGHPYGVARTFFPEKDADEIYDIVGRAMVELFDQDLVMFYRSDMPHGYGAKRDEVEPRDRAEVARAFSDAERHTVDPPDRILFYVLTEKGEELLASLPPDAFPRLDDLD